MTGFCSQCWRLSQDLRLEGLLLRCPSCLPAPEACQPGQHQWRGSFQPGTWVCETCGSVLGSEAIGEDGPPGGA
jgi:hypothetical protein